jgi:DNA-binding XRE family transcriptional regulator
MKISECAVLLMSIARIYDRNLPHIYGDINEFLFILNAVKTGRPSNRARTPFGQKLYAARMAVGLSQAQMAKKLGITQTAYSLWERRTVALRPNQIERLLDLLKIPANDLFSAPPSRKRSSTKAK